MSLAKQFLSPPNRLTMGTLAPAKLTPAKMAGEARMTDATPPYIPHTVIVRPATASSRRKIFASQLLSGLRSKTTR